TTDAVVAGVGDVDVAAVGDNNVLRVVEVGRPCRATVARGAGAPGAGHRDRGAVTVHPANPIPLKDAQPALLVDVHGERAAQVGRGGSVPIRTIAADAGPRHSEDHPPR